MKRILSNMLTVALLMASITVSTTIPAHASPCDRNPDLCDKK